MIEKILGCLLKGSELVREIILHKEKKWKKQTAELRKLVGEISEMLAEVAGKLRTNQRVDGLCGQLQTCSCNLIDLIRKHVGEKEATRLQEQLDGAHRVELLAQELDKVEDKEPYLRKIDEAAGSFQALGRIIGAG